MRTQDKDSQGQSYFQLVDTCKLVEGSERSIIYNIEKGDSFHLQSSLNRLIKALQGGILIQEAVKDVPCSVEQGRKALEALVIQGAGKFYSQPQWTASNPQSTSKAPSFSTKTLYAEITTDCTLDCRFCQPNTNTINRLRGCHRWPHDPETPLIDLADWQRVIDDVIAAEYTKLVMVGGDPLLRWDLALPLIDYARKSGITNIELETNGLKLTQKRS